MDDGEQQAEAGDGPRFAAKPQHEIDGIMTLVEAYGRLPPASLKKRLRPERGAESPRERAELRPREQ